MMMVDNREEDPSRCLAVVTFFGLLACLGQFAYLYRANATFGEFIIGILPPVFFLLLSLGVYAALQAMRHLWLRRALRLLVVLASIAAACTTLVASAGFWKTGSIPRVQQMHGLTWDILAPSVHEIAQKNALILLMVLLFGLLVFFLLWRLLRHAHRCGSGGIKPRLFASVCLVLLVAMGLSGKAGAGKYRGIIATQLFRSDLDFHAASSPEAQLAEGKFFRDYHLKLGQLEGGQPYPALVSKLRGSNVIWLVLESTRAKDVPLYGGSAEMPHLMQAREHMLLLNQLYSQDPRSTKAFAQMDMGRFSLLSWDSYSNNIPWMFPDDGIASHLDKLGYRTATMVNTDESYDHNKNFQEEHGYQLALYRQGLNPGSSSADDLLLLKRIGLELDQKGKPFYFMVWPIETHHPYGREYWSDEGSWTDTHPGGVKHLGAADHDRYLRALHEVDDWFGRLISLLKQKGVYDNTVIIVTGDHGEAFGEHEPGNVFHGNGVYQESVHVAGFIYSPKIDGLHLDNRNTRLLDIPATILNLASDDEYLLNDGRSIFNNYKYEMPIYLFNSWTSVAGIIYNGRKLWRSDQALEQVHSALMTEIRDDPAKEGQAKTHQDGSALLAMLDEWEFAMKARTVQFLTDKAASQPALNDVVRVYCDDGSGFRESLKFSAKFVGLSDTLEIPVDHDCRTLRVAPVETTHIAQRSELDVSFDRLEVEGQQKAWSAGDLKVSGSSNLTLFTDTHFSITGDSAYVDYAIGPEPRRIKSMRMKMTVVWQKAAAR